MRFALPIGKTGYSNHKSSSIATRLYLCMRYFSVYLVMVPAATEQRYPAVLCIRYFSVYLVKATAATEQRYPVVPVYAMI